MVTESEMGSDNIEAARDILAAAGFADTARDLGSLPGLEALHSRTQALLVQGVPVVKVRLQGSAPDGRRMRRTVTAGMDPFLQLLRHRFVPDPLAEQVRSFMPSQSRRLSRIVREAAEIFCNDTGKVGAVQAMLRRQRQERMEKERESLVQSMLDLVASGWTRDDLVAAVDATTVLSVMRT